MKRSLYPSLLLVSILALALTGCGNNITVTVNPGEVTLQPGEIQQFSATVTGTGNTAVTWSVEPQATGGFLDPLHPGKYQAPLTAGTYYVVATSQANLTKFGKAKVNVVTGGGGGGHYYEGTITIERTGYHTDSHTNYDESATITNFKLVDGGNGQWVLMQGSPSTVTAHVVNSMDSGAHVDYALRTTVSTKTTIDLSIKSSTSTYDLLINVFAEGAIVTAANGTSAPPTDWPIVALPIQNQSLDNPSHIIGSITDTRIAQCTITWDFIKK